MTTMSLCINAVVVNCFGIWRRCSRQKLAASIKRYCLMLNVRDDNYLYNRIPFAISHAIDYHPRCDAINDIEKGDVDILIYYSYERIIFLFFFFVLLYKSTIYTIREFSSAYEYLYIFPYFINVLWSTLIGSIWVHIKTHFIWHSLHLFIMVICKVIWY